MEDLFNMDYTEPQYEYYETQQPIGYKIMEFSSSIPTDQLYILDPNKDLDFNLGLDSTYNIFKTRPINKQVSVMVNGVKKEEDKKELPAKEEVSTIQGDYELINKIVNTALSQEGKPYVWGNKGPNSFDCSGLCYYAYKANGVNIPGSTLAMIQGNSGQDIDISQVQPGDIIITQSQRRKDRRHARMVYKVENGQIHVIEAKSRKSGVVKGIYKPGNNIIAIKRYITIPKNQQGGYLNYLSIPVNGFNPLTFSNTSLSEDEEPYNQIVDLPTAVDPFGLYNFGANGAVDRVIINYEDEDEDEEEGDGEIEQKQEQKQEYEQNTEEITVPKVEGKHPGYINDKNTFAKLMLSAYKKELKKKGLDPEYAYTLTASAIIESGWGKSLSAPYNYGGVMASKSAPHTRSWTKNYRNGKLVAEYSNFRNFKSINDYCRFVINLLDKKGGLYEAFDKYSPHDPFTMWYNVLKSGYGGTDDEGKRGYASDVNKIVKDLKRNIG